MPLVEPSPDSAPLALFTRQELREGRRVGLDAAQQHLSVGNGRKACARLGAFQREAARRGRTVTTFQSARRVRRWRSASRRRPAECAAGQKEDPPGVRGGTGGPAITGETDSWPAMPWFRASPGRPVAQPAGLSALKEEVT